MTSSIRNGLTLCWWRLARVEIDKRLGDPERQCHAQWAGGCNNRVKVLAQNAKRRHSSCKCHANDDRSGLLGVDLSNPVVHIGVLQIGLGLGGTGMTLGFQT